MFKLRKYRESTGLPVTWLAVNIGGCSRTQWYSYENGSTPTPSRLIEAMIILDTAIEKARALKEKGKD